MIKQNKKGGVVSDLISGTGGLIFTVVIILVLVATILGANLLRGTATTTTATESGISINNTGFTLVGFDSANRNYALVSAIYGNGTATIPITNLSLNTANGVVKNSTLTVYAGLNITYSYITPTEEERSSSSMSGNFTKGIDNVSSKIPTILLIGAVVLLIGVLLILYASARKSGLMGSGNGGSL